MKRTESEAKHFRKKNFFNVVPAKSFNKKLRHQSVGWEKNYCGLSTFAFLIVKIDYNLP